MSGLACPVCEHAGTLLKEEHRHDLTYRTYRCGGCRSLFCNDHYAAVSPDYISRTESEIDDFVLWCQGKHKLHAYQQLFRILSRQARPIRSVLDIGCGTGGFLQYARERGIENLYGFDASAAQIAVARRQFPAVRQCTSIAGYVNGNGQVPQFDLITLWDVIEHLRDAGQVLDEIHSYCAPESLLFFCTPNGRSEFVKLYMRKALKISHSFVPWEHVLYYSERGLGLMLERHGFEVLHSTATACYRRPLGPVEFVRRLGFAAAAHTGYAPQLSVLCRKRACGADRLAVCLPGEQAVPRFAAQPRSTTT